MKLLDTVGKKFDTHPALIFVYAYNYNEKRLHKKNIGQMYIQYLDTGVLPDFVSDYALDVLNGSVKLPLPFVPPKMLEKHCGKKT
jgi:hypothetical protein